MMMKIAQSPRDENSINELNKTAEFCQVDSTFLPVDKSALKDPELNHEQLESRLRLIKRKTHLERINKQVIRQLNINNSDKK